MWSAQSGAPNVFINGKPAFRINDTSKHCGGTGQLIEGSADVIVGDGGSGGTGSSDSSVDNGSGGRSGGGGAHAPLAEEHWIEIELHTTAGEPMAGARYRIAKPDGTIQEGTLDGSGRARIDGLEKGTCQVSFPDIDESLWRRV
jgi:hypothetical protein